MTEKRKRVKRNVPEIQPPEPKFIESIHETNISVSEIDLQIKIKENYFKKMKSNYIYEINFTKNSKLQQTCENSFRFLHLYSITFPPSLSIIMPESFNGCHFLDDIKFLNTDSTTNTLEIFDNAFIDTQIQSIIIPKNTKKIYSSCFPKSLKSIEFENGAPKLEKIGHNAFFQTQLESFKFPTNIDIFIYPKNIFLHCKKLKELIFDHYIDKKNENFIEKEEEIYEKEKRINRKIKFNKSILNLIDTFEKNEEIIFNVSQDFAMSHLISQTKVEKIEVFVSNLNYFYFFNTPKLTSITVVDGEKGRYTKIKGCLYTKDMKKLIVAERNIKNAAVNSKCQIISNYAFNIKSLEKVDFDKNSELKEISFFAFSESQIKSLDIPNCVDLIDYGVFYKCEKLKTINIPHSFFLIDFFTFSFTNLTKILIPKNIIKITFGCFFHCCNLTSITFEKDSNLIEIDDYAFSFTKIKSISIPKSVKRIGNYCFLNCHDLETVTFDNDTNICQIGFYCFDGTKIDDSKLKAIYQKAGYLYKRIDFMKSFNKENITSIKIPSEIEKINLNAFKDCINLTKVEICDDSNLSKIMDGAFSNCVSLTEMIIPENVDYFGKECFQNCLKYEGRIRATSYRKIFIGLSAFENSGLISFQSESRAIKVCNCAFKNCKKMIQFQAKANIESIFGSSVFVNCIRLKKAFISPSVNKVSFGKCCFMNSDIRKFIIPTNLEVLQHSIFKKCQHLSEVIIDEEYSKVKLIKSEAFQSSGINSIVIPLQTEIIEENSFSDCSNLNNLRFPQQMQLSLRSSCFSNCPNIKEIVLPKIMNIKEIYENTFGGLSIESITLSKSIKRIHKHSFLNCTKLKCVKFLNKIRIDSFAFSGCKQLQTIEIKSLIMLGVSFSDKFNQFNNNMTILFRKNITKNDLINSLFTNETPTFESCNIYNYKISLVLNNNYIINEPLEFFSNYRNKLNYKIAQHINGGYYLNSKSCIYFVDSSINSLSILKETKLIDRSSFEFSNLKKIDFQTGCQLEKIKKFAFRNLQIKEISIPDTVTSIGKQAFYNCSLLKKVNITPHSQLKIIKSNAFEKCGIESFVFPSTLETIKEFAFFECFNLAQIENYSNQIEFGYKSLARSGIEKIKFPSNSVFNDSSFKECIKLKEIIFNGDVNKISFGPESFAFAGLENLEIENDSEVEIKANAFIFCRDLTKVVLTGKNIHCDESSFSYCEGINEFSITKISENNAKYNINYFNRIIKSINDSNVKKFSFTLVSTADDNSTHERKLIIENNCVVLDNKLIEANLINNILPFKALPKSKLAKLLKSSDEIKKNEIIKVPSSVEKIELDSYIPHIKQIKWPSNCIVNDLGPSGLFSRYNLVEITIPKLVQKIPPHLFEHCHSMKIVQFEKGSALSEIGEFAFADTSIEKVDLPNSVQIIKNSSFAYNKKLKIVKFNGEIIGSEAFLQTGLVEFNLSNNTKIIESNAFQFCRCLKKFVIDIENSKLEEIGPYAFYETPITEINIPPDVKVIQKFVFNGCKFLKVVKISSKSKLESIEAYSFSGALSLEMINIPKSISKLSFKAFINTPSLLKIMNESNEQFIVNDSNAVYLKNKSLIFVPRNLKQFEVNKDCTVIHSGSFCGPNLKSVSFQDNSLKYIEESGFAHSTSLKSIMLHKSIKRIGANAFIECLNLETVIFDSNCSLKKIPKFCFAFSGLKRIVLPKFVEIIDPFSFYLCKNLKHIDLYETNVRFIGDSAFCGTNIEKVHFPPTIEYIENHSFEGTKSLKLVDFSSCSRVENWNYGKIENPHDFILEYKKKRKKKLIIEVSSSFQEPPQKDNENNIMSLIAPPKNVSLIFKPSIGNVTPRNSYNNPIIQQSPRKPKTPTRMSLNNPSPRINNSRTLYEPRILRAKLNITCYVQKSAFCNSNVSVFKFDLNEYQWYDFFNKCIQIKEYIINSNISLCLKKLPKERFHYYSLRDFYDYKKKTARYYYESQYLKSIIKEFSFDRLLGSFYKVRQLTWKEQDTIPWKRYGPMLKSIPKGLSPFHFMNTSNIISITFTDDIKIECIPKCCFSNTLLEEITIPKSVTTISRSAFQYSYGLRKVTFSPEIKLKEIENYAFFDCKNLFTISLPDSISVIPEFCFASSGLKEIKLPNSIETIYAGAFHHCNDLSLVHLNEGLKEIDCSSFSFCNSLVSIDLPNSLTIIRSNAFANCANLCNVNINPQSNLTSINDGAFDFTSIEVLKLNSTIQEICKTRNMPKLTKIAFHEGKLLHYAQDKNGIIYKIDQTPSLKNDDNFINSMKFDDMIKSFINSIKNYNNKENDDKNSDEEEEEVNIIKYHHLILKQKQIKKIFFIPKNITCFEYSDELNICGDFDIDKICNGIEDINNNNKDYFVNSDQITQMKFLSKFVIFQDRIFSNFSSIQSIEFGEDVNILKLNCGVFSNCQNLQKIVIPNSCIHIKSEAFKDCFNLKTVLFGKIDSTQENKSSLKTIDYKAFYNCSSIQKIILPPSVSIIGNSAFMNCTKLKRLEFGIIYLNNENKTIVHLDKENESLLSIKEYAFKNCTSLASFRVPKLCEEIESAAFMNCTSLNKLSGHNLHLHKIGERAFFNCSSLTYVHLCITDSLKYVEEYDEEDEEEEEKEKNKMKIPVINGFNIYTGSFMNCFSLKEFIIENDSKQIDTLNQKTKNLYGSIISNNAFRNCTSLTNYTFLIGHLYRIGYNTFMNCSSLKKIVTNVPSYKSIVNDNHMSFNGCPKDLKLDLFNENKKVSSFNILVKEFGKSSKKLFMNHLSTLNKDLFLWAANDNDNDDKKLKVHSTVLNSFDGPAYSVRHRHKENESFCTPGPGTYTISNYNHGYSYSMSSRGRDYLYNIRYRVATEYNYTIPTPRPPLNI